MPDEMTRIAVEYLSEFLEYHDVQQTLYDDSRYVALGYVNEYRYVRALMGTFRRILRKLRLELGIRREDEDDEEDSARTRRRVRRRRGRRNIHLEM